MKNTLLRFVSSLILSIYFLNATLPQEAELPTSLNSLRFTTHTPEHSIWGITEDQLNDLFATSNDLVALHDEHCFHRINDKWTESLGWTREELTTRPYIDFIHPDDLALTKKAAHEGIHKSCVLNFKNRYRNKSGSYHLFEWTALRQVAGSNKATPLLAIAHDLTLTQKALEYHTAFEQAQIVTQLKSNFVAHMSHEIRTPLNGIIGFLEQSLEEKMSPTVHVYLKEALSSSHFLVNVANDIIDISNIENDILIINQNNFNPSTIIHSVISVATLQASKKNLKLITKIDSKLPLMLCGDENRFKQILFNLMSNAIKFTASGSVTLKISGHLQDGIPTTFLLLGQVQDTGIGMTSEFMGNLFQPFSQEEQVIHRQSGAGLGLYITKKLCERLNGSINVMSTPGIGSTFRFHLIFNQPKLSPNSFELGRRKSLNPTDDQIPLSSSSETNQLKILVVEDNKMNQKILLAILKKLGHQVDIADNGLLGLQAVQCKSFDLVLMDGEMPVMDGLEATRQIRKLFSLQQLPIIGVSAHAMATHRNLFLAAGMNGYVSKPIDRAKLFEEIDFCLQNNAT